MPVTPDQTWNRGDWARLIRLFSMGATAVYALLGMATASSRPGPGAALAAVVCGVAFHLFAFPLNDVIDLPIDRTNPRRADSPLVRGLAAPRLMLVVALVQLPLMVVLLGLAGVGVGGFGAWTVAALALGAYDLWGKRLTVPVLADLIQGVGFAALILLGAYWSGTPTALTWLVAGYVVVYIVQINAIHGGVRDLVNDAAHGATTTPILLGCRVDAAGVPILSRSMAAVAVAAEAAMVALLVAMIAATGAAIPRLIVLIAVAIRLFAAWLGSSAYAARHDHSTMMARGVWHLFWSLSAVVVAAVAAAPWWLILLVAAVYLAPPGIFDRVSRVQP